MPLVLPPCFACAAIPALNAHFPHGGEKWVILNWNEARLYVTARFSRTRGGGGRAEIPIFRDSLERHYAKVHY